MPPTRTSTSSQRPIAGPSGNPDLKSSHVRRSSGGGQKRGRSDEEHVAPGSSSLPGIQKLKSALRQTRRLLAKDDLAADVRVETERRLRALEGDLREAERRNKERTLATRYHRIKFFERQKVVRKIKQIKRELASSEKSELKPPSRKTLKSLQDALYSARVDLNYIMHYPKLEKYVSLFPSSTDAAETQQPGDEAEGPSDMNTKTDAKREKVRASIRSRMEAGELSLEPELEGRSKDSGTSMKGE